MALAALGCAGCAPTRVLAACPVWQPPPMHAGGGPRGVGVPMSKTIAASDTRSSLVLDANRAPQIRCTTAGRTAFTDVVYASPTLADGSKLDLKMDVIVPEGSAPRPVVLFVPGGGFQISRKEGALNLRSYVVDAGFVVASIEYRTLRNGAVYRDAIADVKSAIRYLRANAGLYHIDPARVAVWGQSAGGYLATMVGTTNGDAKLEIGDHLDQSSAVQAVVDQFGPSELTRIADDFDDTTKAAYAMAGSFVAQFVLGVGSVKALADEPAAAAMANPITHVAASDPPFLIEHGSADNAVSPSQTLLLHSALRAAHVDSTRYVIAGAGHGDLNPRDTSATLPWSSQPVMDTIVGFLRKKLK